MGANRRLIQSETTEIKRAYWPPHGQNRRQKVVNWGALPLCGGFTLVQGGLTFKFDKNSTN